MVDSTTHIAGAVSLTVTVTLSKDGGGFAGAAGAVTEIANGWYSLAGNVTDRNTLGELAIHATATGADPTDEKYEIVNYDPFIQVNANVVQWLSNAVAASAIPTFSAGVLGGLAILGTVIPTNAAGTTGGFPLVGTQIPTATAGANGGLIMLGVQIPTASVGFAGGLPQVQKQIPTATAGATDGIAITSSLSGGGANVNVVQWGGVVVDSGAIPTVAVGLAGGLLTLSNGADFADAFLDRNMGSGSDSGSASFRTPRQALRLLRNKWTTTSSTLTVFKEDDATVSWTSVVGSLAGADPIVSNDPA